MSAPKSRSRAASNAAGDAAAAARESVEQAVRTGTEAAARSVEQAFGAAREQIDQAGEFAFRGVGELAGINQAALDAVAAASGEVSRGVEVLSREVAASARASMENSMAVTRRLMTVRSLKEFADIQADYARSSLDEAVAGTIRLQELSTKIASDAAAPLAAYWSAAVGKTLKPVAA